MGVSKMDPQRPIYPQRVRKKSVGLIWRMWHISKLLCISQDSRLRTQNSGLRTQNSGLGTQDSELRTRDSGLRTQNSDLKTQDSGLRIPPPHEQGGVSAPSALPPPIICLGLPKHSPWKSIDSMNFHEIH